MKGSAGDGAEQGAEAGLRHGRTVSDLGKRDIFIIVGLDIFNAVQHGLSVNSQGKGFRLFLKIDAGEQ